MNDLFVALAAAELDEIEHNQRMMSDPQYRDAYYAKLEAKWEKKMAKQIKKDEIEYMLNYANNTIFKKEAANLPEKIATIKQALSYNKELTIKEKFSLRIKLLHYRFLLMTEPKRYQDVIAYYEAALILPIFVSWVAVFTYATISGSLIYFGWFMLVVLPFGIYLSSLIRKNIVNKIAKQIT